MSRKFGHSNKSPKVLIDEAMQYLTGGKNGGPTISFSAIALQNGFTPKEATDQVRVWIDSWVAPLLQEASEKLDKKKGQPA